MKTDVIEIFSDLKGQEAVLEATEKFVVYNGITGKDAMHLRLLTEEAVSLVHGILDDFKGDFWLESNRTKNTLSCKICLSVEKSADEKQEEEIISISTKKRNESAKGIMGKIREIVRWSVQSSSSDEKSMKNMADAWWNMGAGSSNYSAPLSGYWSLKVYRDSITDSDGEQWDELEKSIVAKLADEVKVWLNKETTEVIIEKNFNI